MTTTYKSSWDEIWEKFHRSLESYDPATAAKYAVEFKSAVETIEQQKKMADYTSNLVIHQKRTNRATWTLAALTFVLVISTAFSAFFSYKALMGSEEQIEVMNKMTAISEQQIAAISDLQESIQAVPQSIDKLTSSVLKIPEVAEFIRVKKERQREMREYREDLRKKRLRGH